MGPQEHLLRDLFGFGGIAQHPEGDAEYPVLVGAHEFLERTPVTGPQPTEKGGRLVACLMHGKTIP